MGEGNSGGVAESRGSSPHARAGRSAAHLIDVATSTPERLRDVASRLQVAGRSSAESEARALWARLRGLESVVAELTGDLPLERIAAVVADAALTALDASVVAIVKRDDDGRSLRAVRVVGLRAAARRRLAAIPADDSSLIAQVARSGRPVYLQSFAGELLDPPVGGSGAGPGALAVVPLPSTVRPLGAMVLGRRNDLRFGDDDRVFLTALAGLCSLALERLQLSTERSHARAIARRRQLALGVPGTRLQVGDMEIDVGEQRILVNGHREASLTPSEIRLLMFLAEEPGRPRGRREILQHLWHTDHVGNTRACDVHVSNVRRKIEHDPSRPQRLVTVRGVGYTLNVP